MQRGTTIRAAILLLGPAILCVAPATAQTVSASIRGNVVDEGGKVVVGATVRAVEIDTGFTRTVTTEAEGAYQFTLLRPGLYDLIVEVDGYATARTGLDLALGARPTINFELRMAISERLEVSAASPAFDPSTTALGLRVDQETIRSLPLNGRMFTDLALLSSAVRQAQPGVFFGEQAAILTMNGSSARSNSYLVDGSDNNDFVFGTRNNSFYSAEVIQEFQLLTDGYSAEFGRASGGVMNIITRSGTNQFSGSTFYQVSNDSWNGTSGIADRVHDSGLNGTGLDRQQFGVSVSGPFVKDTAFYFAAYEGGRTDDIIGYTGVDRDGNPGGQFESENNGDRLFARTDFHLSSTNYLAVRLSYAEEFNNNLNVIGRFTPEAGADLEERDFQAAVSLRSIFTPKLFNEARFLWSTSDGLQIAHSTRPGVERPSGVFGGNDLASRDQQETQFQFVDNFTLVKGDHTLKFGVDISRVSVNVSTTFNPNGVFLYSTNEPLEAGDTHLGSRSECFFRVDPITGENYQDCSMAGIGDLLVDDDGDGITDEIADFHTYPTVYRIIDGTPSSKFEDGVLGIFVQDEWRARDDFNLNFGLRYDLETFELGDEYRVDSFIPNGGAPRDTNNLAPRLSFTWMPTGTGQFLLRGGAGMFYDKVVLGFPAISAITSQQKISFGFFEGLGFPCDENFLEDVGVEAFKTACGVGSLPGTESAELRFSTGDTLDTPYTVQWNLGFDRRIGQNFVFGMNYIHARGHHIPVFRDLNPVVGEKPLAGGFIPRHLDDSVGSIAAIETMGNTWHDGITAQLQKIQGPFRFLLSYTWSKSFDESPDPLKGGVYLPPDSFNISGERARSDNDQRHRLVWSGTWDTPWWGLRISPVFSYASGAPFNVVWGIDDNSRTLGIDLQECTGPPSQEDCRRVPLPDGFVQERPEGIGRNTGAGTPLALINEARADLGLAEYTGILEEPEFVQLDLRISRTFNTGGGSSIEAFLQVFNVFNRENLGMVDGAINSTTFGVPLAVVGPARVIEIGARVGF